MDTGSLRNFAADESPIDAVFPYAKAISSLLWLGTVARPDVTFAVNVLSRYIVKPQSSQVTAVKRVIRYLKGTRDRGLVYSRARQENNKMPIAYSDSDWGGDYRNGKSTTGFVIMVNGAALSWRSKKRTVVATYTAEAEYMAASACADEVIWFRHIFEELTIDLGGPTPIHMDNRSAISMACKEAHQSRSKAIALRAHHVKDHIASNNVNLLSVKGDKNPADIFTNPLPLVHHRECVEWLGMS
jgi:hypothetical protein